MSAAEERRRHTRETLDHAALLEHADLGARACRLRDVSVGGALVVSEAGLEVGRCSPGDLVQMRFNVPTGVAREAGDTQIVSGRVVRVLRNALGIAFLDATARALGVLRRLVELHRHSPDRQAEHAAVLTRLAEAISAFQREQAPRFLQQIDAALLRAARSAEDDREARVLTDAHRCLVTQRAELLGKLEADLARQLAERLEHRVLARPLASNDNDGLALLDLAVFEGVLLAQRCLEVVERRDPRLFHRYRRALDLLPPPGEGARDPLEPLAILNRFAEAAQGVCREAAARPVLARAFEEALEAPLRQLLAQLVELLPAPPPLVTPHAPRAQAAGSTAGARGRAAAQRASDFGDHGPLDGNGVPARPGKGSATAPGRRLSTGGAAPAGPAGTSIQDGAWPWAGGPAITGGVDGAANHYPPGAVPATGVLAGSLPTFAFPSPPTLAPATLASRLLARQPGAGAPRREMKPSDWQQWFAAFAARVDLEAEGVPASERAGGLYQRLLVERADLGTRPPGGELLAALQLAEAHWEALAADPCLHPGVLGTISRLRAWLHGWGLREPRWMLRDEDPLAALLDRLAALWPHATTEAGVTELVEAVCQRLVDDPDLALADPSLLQTLEGALSVQRVRAQERILDLVRENDESRSNTLTRRRTVTGPTSRPDEAAHPLRHWLGLAQAWRRGDLAFLQRGKRTQPVELIWVDAQATDFLFADPAGGVVATMTRQELAVHLHRGTLRRRDRPHEPLSRRVRDALLERLASAALRVEAVTLPERMVSPGPDGLATTTAADPDRTLRLDARDPVNGVTAATPVVWREADGRILESHVLPLAGGTGSGAGERFLEVVSVSSGDVNALLCLPELAGALAASGVRRRLDLALWDHTLTHAESAAGDGDWALRLSAHTLLDADGFEAFQSRLLEAAVPPRRFTLVIDMGPGAALPEALGELLHALDALGLRAALDASGTTLAGWRHLPVARVWVRAPEQGASEAERERFCALADFARWAEWPLVATVAAASLSAAELATLGVTHLATPREWSPLPEIQ